MIKGQKRQEYTLLNKENILNRITEADIIMAFWPAGKPLKWNRAISSPFRNDSNPSFVIGNKYGNIQYIDYGDYSFRGDVFKFVEQIEGIGDFNAVLQAIDSKFQLGLGSGNPIKGKSTVITWEPPKIELKPPPFIQVITRKFNKTELEWWAQYFIDIQDLKEEYIYAPREIYRNRRKLPNTELTFCYYYPELEKWKIYRPLCDGKGKKVPVHLRKWDTNVQPFDYVEHLNKIQNCDIAYLEKSRKDRIVLKKALELDCIAVTNAEDPSCISDEAIIHIKNNSRIQVACGDNDKKGKQWSWYLTKEHGYLHCNAPDHYLEKGITDFADMAKYTRSLETVRQHFASKNLLPELLKTA